MDKNILPHWKKLEAHSDRIFSQLEKYSEAILQKQPDAHAWSVSQNVAHLILTERKSLDYMQKKLSHTDMSSAKKAGLGTLFRLWALRTAFALPGLKFKAPSYIEPIAVKDLKSMQIEWVKLRQEYKNFLEKLPPAWLDAELWNHQRAGKMSVKQMLIFFTDHVDRHARQIERTLKQVRHK